MTTQPTEKLSIVPTLAELYIHWRRVQSTVVLKPTWSSTFDGDRFLLVTDTGRLWVPAYVACLWVVFEDSPERADAARIFAAAKTDDAIETPERTDLTVRADQLQAAGDERGQWLAAWLMSPGWHCEAAMLETVPALAKRMQELLEQARKRRYHALFKDIDYGELENRVLNWWTQDMLSAQRRLLHGGKSFDHRLLLNMPARHGMSMGATVNISSRRMNINVHDEIAAVSQPRAPAVVPSSINQFRLSLESVLGLRTPS